MSEPAREVDELLGALLDRSITSEQMARLGTLIRTDRSIADRAAELMLVSSDLAEHTQRRDPSAAPAAIPFRPGRNSAKVRVSHNIFIWSGVVAAMLFVGAVIVIVVARPGDTPRSAPPGVAASVVDLGENASLAIGDDLARVGSAYRGKRLALDAGSAELLVGRGAVLTMRGRTTLFMHGDLAATLDRGFVDFTCPPTAHGLTVTLGGPVRIVDLGTRFVAARTEGAPTRVRVVEGSVRIDAGESSTTLEPGSVVELEGGAMTRTLTLAAFRGVPLENAALRMPATQSSDHYPGRPGPPAFGAGNAVDGRRDTFTSTRAASRPDGTEPDLTPWWRVDLGAERSIHRVVIHNRLGGPLYRLRDITVYILDERGGAVFTSEPINPRNELNNPLLLTLDLIDEAGLPLRGRTVRIERAYDPDNLADAPNTVIDDAVALSLGEVEILAELIAPAPDDTNPTPPASALSAEAEHP